MNHFNRERSRHSGGPNRFGSGGGFQKRSIGGGGRDSGPNLSHKAICSECGRNCEVPFKPTGNRPVLCNDCFQESKGGSAKSFGNSDRSFRDFGRKGKEFSSSGMHSAICDDCGQTCEVPFRPSGDKPIYCSNCFQNHKEGGFRDQPGKRPSFDSPKMHLALCDGCGDKFELPFQPTGSKPVYCNSCFGKEAGIKEDKVNAMKQQFDVLNEKLDKLIKLLLPTVSAPKESVKKVMEEKEEKSAPLKKEAKKAASPKETKKTSIIKTKAVKEKDKKKAISKSKPVKKVAEVKKLKKK